MDMQEKCLPDEIHLVGVSQEELALVHYMPDHRLRIKHDETQFANFLPL